MEPGSRMLVAALLFIGVPEKEAPSRTTAMRALYGLTPAESRIADLLLQGLEIGEVANRIGTTVETTRFHVKGILAKTGCRRLTDLMRLMLSVPSLS